MTLRYIALLGGAVCVACETWGTFDFLYRDQGALNYLVVGGCVVTMLAGAVPVFAHEAAKAGRRWAVAGCWLALPIALAFIFTAAIQRTGGAADTAQQDRSRAERAMRLAERAEAEASAALKIDIATVTAECATGRKEKCAKAKLDQAATQDRLDKARADLRKAPVHQEDAMGRRLASFLPLTEDQIRLYQPMMLPVLLSIFGALFLSLGAPAVSNQQAAGAVPAAPAPKAVERRAVQPAAPVATPAKPAPPHGSIAAFLAECLDTDVGAEVDVKTLMDRYNSWCAAKGSVPFSGMGFVNRFAGVCEKAGIRMESRGKRIVCLDMRLCA